MVHILTRFELHTHYIFEELVLDNQIVVSLVYTYFIAKITAMGLGHKFLQH